MNFKQSCNRDNLRLLSVVITRAFFIAQGIWKYFFAIQYSLDTLKENPKILLDVLAVSTL